MSDRYQTPRWGDEADEDKPDNPASDRGEEPFDASREHAPDTASEALDASSENVLDSWPAPVEPEHLASDPELEPDADADPATSPGPDALAEPSEREEPAPLADRLSATMEHAPGALTVPPGYAVLEGAPSGERRSVGIVVARFNGDVTTLLLESALAELDACGVAPESVTVMPVPGAFELPLAAMALAKTRRFACVVALGCVIRGDTPHFDFVSAEAASGIQLAGIETGVPVSFGVLTLDREDQAESRVGKGAEAVRTGLEMADVFANLRAAAAR